MMENHQTEAVAAASSLSSHQEVPPHSLQAKLLPGQMERLQAQITAYKYLSRNMPVPPEILARAGPPEPIAFGDDVTSDEYENDYDSNTISDVTGNTFVDPHIRRAVGTGAGLSVGGAAIRRRGRYQDPGTATLLGNYMSDHSNGCTTYAPMPIRHVIDDINTHFNSLRDERVRSKVHYRVEELLAVIPQLPVTSQTRHRAENEMKALRLLDFQKRLRYQISQGITSMFLMDSAFDTEAFAPALPFAASGGLRVCYEPELPTLRTSTLREQGYKVFLNAVLDRSARMSQARRAKASARAKVCEAVITVTQQRKSSNETVNEAYTRISNMVMSTIDNSNIDETVNINEEEVEREIVAQEIAINMQPFQLEGIRWLHKMYARGLSCVIGDDKDLIAMSYVSCFVANMARLGTGFRFLVITESAAINEWLHYLTHFASNVETVVYDGAPAVRRELYRRYISPAVPSQESAVIITTAQLGFSELALDAWAVAIIDEGFSAGLRGSIFEQASVTPLPNTRSKVMFLRYAWPTPGDELKVFHFVCNKIISTVEERNKMLEEDKNKNDGDANNVITINDDNDADAVVDEAKISDLINKYFVLQRNISDVRGLISDRFYTVIRCRMSSLQQAMYRDICEGTYNSIEIKRALEEGREPPKPIQRYFNAQSTESSLVQLQYACTHPFVLADQYSFDDNIIRSSGKFVALDQILSKVGAFSNIHRFAIYTRKRKIAQILMSYLKLRDIDFLELRDPAEVASELDPTGQSLGLDGMNPAAAAAAAHNPNGVNPDIPSIHDIINLWNNQDEKARCVLISTLDTESLPLARTDTAIFLDPDWVPKVSTNMAFPMLGYDNTNPANVYFSLKLFHLVTAYSVEENMLVIASNSTNWNAESQAMADPETFEKLCDNKTKQSILEAYLFKCSSIKYLENNQKELPLAIPGPLFNYAIARNNDELILFNQIDQSTSDDNFPRLLVDDGMDDSGNPVGESMLMDDIVTDPNTRTILAGSHKKVSRKNNCLVSKIFKNTRQTSGSSSSSSSSSTSIAGMNLSGDINDMKEEVNGEEYLSKLTHLTLNNLCPGLPYNINNDGSVIGEATEKDLEEFNSILAQKQHLQEQTQLRSIQQQQQGIPMQAMSQLNLHASPRKSPRKSRHDRHSKKDQKSKKDRDRHRGSSSSSNASGISNVILNANGSNYISTGLMSGEPITSDKDQMIVKQIRQPDFIQQQPKQQQQPTQQQLSPQQQQSMQMMQQSHQIMQDQQGAYIPQLMLPQQQQQQSPVQQPQGQQQMATLMGPAPVAMGNPGMMVQGLGEMDGGGGVPAPVPSAVSDPTDGGVGGPIIGTMERGGEEEDAGEEDEIVENLASGSVVAQSISPHLILPKEKNADEAEKESTLNSRCKEIIDSLKSITEPQGTLMCMPLLTEIPKGNSQYTQSPGSLDDIFNRTYSTHEAYAFDMSVLFSNATNYYQDQQDVVRNIDQLYRCFRDLYKSSFDADLAIPPRTDGEYAVLEKEYKKFQKHIFGYDLNPNYDEIIYDYADSSKFGNGDSIEFNGSGSSEDEYEDEESSESESDDSSSGGSDSESGSSSGSSDRNRRKRRGRDSSDGSLPKKRHHKSSKSSRRSSKHGSSNMYAGDDSGSVVLSNGIAPTMPVNMTQMGVIPSALTQDAVQTMGMHQYSEKSSKSRHRHGHSHSHSRHHHHRHRHHHRSNDDSGVTFHSGLMIPGSDKKKHNK